MTDSLSTKPFQARVVDWMMETFSMEVCRNTTERNHRFLEESLELVQAMGCTASEAHQLVDYVYGRPVGEHEQEVGGVMVTLAALCSAADISMNDCAHRELMRCWQNIERIRAKQASKPAHSPLPGISGETTTTESPSYPSAPTRSDRNDSPEPPDCVIAGDAATANVADPAESGGDNAERRDPQAKEPEPDEGNRQSTGGDVGSVAGGNRISVEPNGCHGLDTPDRVCFYEQDFYVLSNFSAFNLRWQENTFPTSEHAYHWSKFAPGTRDAPAGRFVRDDIKVAPSAHEAFKLAERWKSLRYPDWDARKVDVMRDILRAKAEQHPYVLRKLLATGDRELVENSWRDDYWGWGPNHDGQNMLGKLWMEIRAELHALPVTKVPQ